MSIYDKMTTHKNLVIEECPQATTIVAIEGTLRELKSTNDRLEVHSIRQTQALEQIAAQGITVQNHERRLDIIDKNLDEIYPRIRKIEILHAEEKGAEKVTDKQEQFWTELRLKLVTPLVIAAFFIMWVLDKIGAIEWLVRNIQDFKG